MKHLDKQDSELKSEVLMMKSQMVETKKNFELKLQNATKKSKAPERETCPALTFNSFSELRDNLNTFCQGYDRVDLVHEDVLNFAFVHIDDSHIPTSKAKELNHKARFEVHDHCPSKLFAAKDISVQNIDGNVMFIVHLDKTSKNGYLMKAYFCLFTEYNDLIGRLQKKKKKKTFKLQQMAFRILHEKYLGCVVDFFQKKTPSSID